MQMDARDIPFHEEFKVIGVFDILEHIEIEEDDRVLKQVHEALMPSGFL
jgi:predicted SAM-dependent methyltransferase